MGREPQDQDAPPRRTRRRARRMPEEEGAHGILFHGALLWALTRLSDVFTRRRTRRVIDEARARRRRRESAGR